MRRRTFLFALVTLHGALGLRPVRGEWSDCSDGSDPEPRLLDLASSLSDSPAVQSVGRAYLEKAPEEDDRAVLVRLISTALLDSPDARTRDQTATLVFEQVRSDFAANRTVRVRDWLLSVTEARLCALTVARHSPGEPAN